MLQTFNPYGIVADSTFRRKRSIRGAEAGIEITPDNQPIEGWRRFYVCDPGGNRIEIAERR